jgi:preprotein translocase subunit SecE
MAQEQKAPRRPIGARIVNYFREARTELSRVTWSTRQEIMESTQVILVFAVVATILLGLVDGIFRFISVRLP